MKKENTSVQLNTAFGVLPAGAKLQSAKGHRNNINGHSMELTYSLGSSTVRTIIHMGGHRA